MPLPRTHGRHERQRRTVRKATEGACRVYPTSPKTAAAPQFLHSQYG